MRGSAQAKIVARAAPIGGGTWHIFVQHQPVGHKFASDRGDGGNICFTTAIALKHRGRGSSVIFRSSADSANGTVLPMKVCIAPWPWWRARRFQPVQVASGALTIGARTPATSLPSASTDGRVPHIPHCSQSAAAGAGGDDQRIIADAVTAHSDLAGSDIDAGHRSKQNARV